MNNELDVVLFHALRHFVHLDEANAAIHMASVQYSPITFALAKQLVEFDPETSDPTVRTVLSHVGLYKLDPGRIGE